MFEDVSKSLKNFAAYLIAVGGILAIALIVISLVMFGVSNKPDELWPLLVIGIIGGIIALFSFLFFAYLSYGFAEIIENTKHIKNISKNISADNSNDKRYDNELPEL